MVGRDVKLLDLCRCSLEAALFQQSNTSSTLQVIHPSTTASSLLTHLFTMQASTSRCAWLCSRPLISAASTAPTPASLANPTRSMSVRAYRRRLEKKKLRRNKPPSPTAMTFSEALRVLKAVSPGDTRSAFDLTLLSRLAASVNVNSLRGRAFLPHDASSAKKKKLILVFAEGDLAEVAKAEGADVVGGEELVDKVR